MGSYLQTILQLYIIANRPDRVPSSTQIFSLTGSILMILIGQANAWYATKPEPDLLKDLKRKIAIAFLLFIPNTAILGGGVFLVLLWQDLLRYYDYGYYYYYYYILLFAFIIPIIVLITAGLLACSMRCCCSCCTKMQGGPTMKFFGRLYLAMIYLYIMAIVIFGFIAIHDKPTYYRGSIHTLT